MKTFVSVIISIFLVCNVYGVTDEERELIMKECAGVGASGEEKIMACLDTRVRSQLECGEFTSCLLSELDVLDDNYRIDERKFKKEFFGSTKDELSIQMWEAAEPCLDTYNEKVKSCKTEKDRYMNLAEIMRCYLENAMYVLMESDTLE